MIPIDKLNEEDRNAINKVLSGEIEISKVFYIWKISKCKICNMINDNYCPFSNVSIRFERIKNADNSELKGFIPCFYGAVFNKTKFIPSIGSPFLFPVLNSQHIEDMNVSHLLQMDSFTKRVQLLRKDECFKIEVTDLFGKIINMKDPKIGNLIVSKENIFNREIFKTYIAIIIIKKGKPPVPINGASFLDEKELFKNKFPLLC